MATYLQKETKLWLPRREEILLIDDGGSASEDLLCFSCVLINKEIEEILKNELNQNGIEILHARSLRGNNKKVRLSYEKAFDIFYKTLRKTKNKLTIAFLADKKLFQDLGEKYKKDFGKYCRISEFGSLDNMLKQLFQQGIFPTLETMRKAAENHNYPRINLTIKLANSGHMWKFKNRITIPNIETLILFINLNLQKIHGDRFVVTDLKIDSAQREPVMSIVDAIANFSFNYIKNIIKEDRNAISSTERMKSDVFRNFLSRTELTADAKEFDDKLKAEFFYKDGKYQSLNNSYMCIDLK